MIIKYDDILSKFSDLQDILKELSDIKRITSTYGSGYTLILSASSLRSGSDLKSPKMTDIKMTQLAGDLATNVIYRRSDGQDIVLKGKCLCTGFHHRDTCSERSTDIPF